MPSMISIHSVDWKYSRTSMARTLTARLPGLFLWSLGNNPLAADLGNLV